MRPSSATATDRDPQVGARIRQAREAAGLSQRQLATALDVRRESVQGWEAGRSAITWKNLRNLEVVLDVSADWVRFGDLDEVPAHDEPPADPAVPLSTLVTVVRAAVSQALERERLGDRFDRIDASLDAIARDARQAAREVIEQELGDARRRSQERRSTSAAAQQPRRREGPAR